MDLTIYEHIFTVELNEPLIRRNVGLLGSHDKNANRFGARLNRDGIDVATAGCAVYGYFIRPNDETILIKGTADSNLVYVDLPDSCYFYDGAFTVAVKISNDDFAQTVLICDGIIEKTTSDVVAEGEYKILSVAEIAEKMAEVDAVAKAADNAAKAAGNAATEASDIAQELRTAKDNGEFNGKDGKDGEDGYTPQKNIDYFDGKDGEDGVGIAIVAVTRTPDENGFYYITINLTDGQQQVIPYKNGKDGNSGVHVGSEAPTEEDTTVWIDPQGETYSITDALGYIPADAEDVRRLSEEIDVVPDYVKTEAMSVLDKVIAAQGERTFVLAAITDMHYGSSDYTDGVVHACQGLQHISERIKFDALAVLGDFTDEHQMDTETAVTDLEEMNALLDPLRVNANLRLKGNHDNRPDAAAQTYRYIMAYSDDVVWGSRIGGYFLRDFDAYKLRVICLNTTEVARDNLSVSDAQYQWFADALDISAKPDAAEWGILLLSHHPLDWTVTSGVYKFGAIINAYQTGKSWTDGTATHDYKDKNAAPLIANIHGHLHNLLTAKLYSGVPGNSDSTNVWRMCTPASRVDAANHYGSPWKEATTYSKTQNTENDTAFCVYCIDLNERTVKAYCYGAGYDREIVYDAGGQSGSSYINQIPISTDANGNVYNGKGWKENIRISSSGAESDGTSYKINATGYIPFKSGDVLRASAGVAVLTETSGNSNISFFNASKTHLGRVKLLPGDLGIKTCAVLNEDGSFSLTCDEGVLGFSGVGFVRVCSPGINDNAILTVNQVIE